MWAGRVSWPWEAVFGVLTVLSVLPLWLVDHPPIQDLPQHLAAIRVLHDFGATDLAFGEYFELTLGRTQYLAYYVVAHVLAFPLGVELANRVLLSIAIVGTPYAMRSLLGALGRDQRLALFLIPLAWNAHLILGFLNFVAAIPLALVGLALAARLRIRFGRGRALALALLSVVTFYTHVVPFAFLGLGAALILMGDGPLFTLKRWLVLAPAAAATLVWSQVSPAGQSTLGAALLGRAEGGPEPQFQRWGDALRDLGGWLTDVLHSEHDEYFLVSWFVLVLTMMALGAGHPFIKAHAHRPLRRTMARRLALLAPLALLGYFLAPASYDWIWPINARFPLLALVFLIPLIPVPRRANLPFLALAVLCVMSSAEVASAFMKFETDEVGELEEAIDAIPPGRRVAGLVFDRGSREVKFSPFIHTVAWYQARKGGAVMFTFADFPQSPFRFREDRRPPRVPPRWEWMPERVDPARDLSWYEYVLVRGGPGRIANQQSSFESLFRGRHYSVWRRLGSGP